MHAGRRLCRRPYPKRGRYDERDVDEGDDEGGDGEGGVGDGHMRVDTRRGGLGGALEGSGFERSCQLRSKLSTLH